MQKLNKKLIELVKSNNPQILHDTFMRFARNVYFDVTMFGSWRGGYNDDKANELLLEVLNKIAIVEIKKHIYKKFEGDINGTHI